MAYVNYEYYKTLYGDKAVPETDFNRLSWDACRKVDIATTGIDNVKKLKVAFPTDEDDSETVRRCICVLIDMSVQIEKAAQNHVLVSDNATGTVHGKIVTSRTAGNESISYSAGTSNLTDIEKAAVDSEFKEKLYRDIIREHLSGVVDANNVNLLYMGQYPN